MKMIKNFITLFMLLILCESSHAAVSRQAVNNAWKRITTAANFNEIPVNFESESEPNAWVYFRSENDYSVHVTTGLMQILRSESEIAGVLGHELGHIVLGHYNNDVLIDTAKIIMNANSDKADTLANAVGNIEFELRESSFSREQESQADEYGTKILTRAGYDSRGLYDAVKGLSESGFIGSESGGFNSHPAGHERLSQLAELAGINSKSESDSKIDELAKILLGNE